VSPLPNFAGVRLESLDDRRWSTPYRGIVTGRPTLRLTISIAPRGMMPCEVRIDVDDASVEVTDHRGGFALSGIEALFVVERQPPAWRFLTWYGVFGRRHGRGDRMIVETPDGRVARFIERRIEERLGLRDVPVRGEVRCG
jgi:hypothetical protein